jgi:hypothetical protein
MKEYIMPVVLVLVALIAYDLFIKKLVVKSSYEEAYEEVS